MSQEKNALTEAIKRQKAFQDRMKKAKKAREREEQEKTSGDNV